MSGGPGSDVTQRRVFVSASRTRADTLRCQVRGLVFEPQTFVFYALRLPSAVFYCFAALSDAEISKASVIQRHVDID